MTTQIFETIAGTLECRRPYPEALYIEEWFLNEKPIFDYDGYGGDSLRAFGRLVADTLRTLTEGGTPKLSEGIVALIPVKESEKLLPRYEEAAQNMRQRDEEILSQWPAANGLIDEIGRVANCIGLLRARIAK